MSKELKLHLRVDADTGAVTAFRNSFNTLDKTVQKTSSGVSGMLGSIGRFASIGSVAYLAKEALGIADAYSLLEGKLKNVTTSQEQLTAAEQGIFAISQATRTEVGATTDLYVSLSGALGQMGKSQKDVLSTTDLVNKAIAVSGGTAQQSQAAVTQFGQALGSGKLGGDELTSLLENGRGLAQALADGLGVPIGALKGMGEQGKLTSDVLIDALTKSADSINTKFANVPVTIGQSFTQVTNSVGQLVDEWNEATGTTNTLASWGTGLSEWITQSRVEIIEFGRDVGRVFQLMGTSIVGGFQVLRAGFYGIVVGIGEGINSLASGWDSLTVGMQNAFKSFADATGKIFYDVINFILGKISDAINKVSSGVSGALSYAGIANPFGQVTLSVGEYTSSIKEATKTTGELINLDLLKSVQKDALEASNIALDTGLKLWDEIANNTTKATKAVAASTVAGVANTNATNENTKAKEKLKKASKEQKKEVEDLSGAYRDFLKLTGQDAKLFALDAEKQLKDLVKLFDAGKISAEDVGKAYDNGIWKKHIEGGKDANKEIALDFSQQFEGLFQGLISGDLGGAVSGLFSGVSQELSKNVIGGLSNSVSGLLGGDTTGKTLLSSLTSGDWISGAIGLASGLLSSLLGGDTEQTPPVLDDMAKTSDSMANSLDYIKSVQYPMLALTREMTGYLSNMDKAFSGAENSLLRSGLDLGGSSYKGTAKAGFLGLTSKSTELFGTSIRVASSSIAELMNGWANATLLETTKTVKKGVFKSSTTYNTTGTNISNQLASYLDEAVTATFQSLTSAGKALNISTYGLANQRVDLGTFDTTGMSAAEVTAELEGRFSAQIDAISELYFGKALEDFQQGSEGLAETLYRVVTTFDQVRHSMELIGKSVYWQGANIIADSAGGIDALNSALSSYMSNFFSEQEQYDQQLTTMTKNFASLGLDLPSNNEEFRQLIEGINTTTDAGAKLFGEVITLANGFSQMTSAAGDLAETQKKLAEEQAAAASRAVSSIADVWTGSLSFLSLQDKADFASSYLSVASASKGNIDTVEAARLAAETGLKSTQTLEEYKKIFERYAQEIKVKAIEEASTADVVDQLKILISKVEDIEAVSRRSIA